MFYLVNILFIFDFSREITILIFYLIIYMAKVIHTFTKFKIAKNILISLQENKKAVSLRAETPIIMSAYIPAGAKWRN